MTMATYKGYEIDKRPEQLSPLTRETIAEALLTRDLAIKEQIAKAWDEGYMRGQHPWTSLDQADPIPSADSPPTSGKNANPYR